MNLGRHSEESSADFGDDLAVLAKQAYSDWQPGARDLVAFDQYLDELFPEQLSFSVRQRRPKTINEAVSATVEIEILLQTIPQSAQKPVSPCEHDASSRNEHDHTANSSEEKLMEINAPEIE